MKIRHALFTISSMLFAQDPNFHIYLGFGQSNMAGNAAFEAVDQVPKERLKLLQSVDCSNLNRTQDNWYEAVPPTALCYSGLSPMDWFGRTLVDSLPESIEVGILNVAVHGSDIRIFDKDLYGDYTDNGETWFANIVAAYNGNPYAHLIARAKRAQQDGVIKGILLHQGETNTNDANWPQMVKTIYENLLTDLSLNGDSVPLIAGEMLYAAEGGCCSSHNTIVNKLPEVVPNSYVVSSEGIPGEDYAHFTAEGYRELGKRYANKMFELYPKVEEKEEEVSALPKLKFKGSGNEANISFQNGNPQHKITVKKGNEFNIKGEIAAPKSK